MEKKSTYVILFLVLFLVSAISFLIVLSPNNITGLTLHEGFDPAAAAAQAEAAALAASNENNDFFDALGLDTTNTASGTSSDPTLTSLQSSLTSLQQRISSLESSSGTSSQELSRINANVQSLSAQIANLQQKVDGQINTLSTGLAGVQQNIDTTKTELSEIEKKVGSGGSGKVILFVIIILLATAGGIYYMTQMRSQKRLNPQILNYITNHIQQGMKYPHIKSNLLNAGWPENEIEWAYKETAKTNYKQYQKKKKKTGADKRKIAAISFGGLLLILAFVVIVKGGSTGQAYQIYGDAADYEEGTGLGRNISRSQCFPPRVMISGSCCDDRNSNNVCDSQESYTELDTSSLTGTITIQAADATAGIQTQTVQIGATGFSPQQLTIRAGDTIIFANNRQNPSRVIPGQGCPNFNHPLISPGQTFSYQFETTGTCAITVGVGSNNEACIDDNQCAGARNCLNNQCKFVSDLFQTSGCTESCTIIRSKISTFHTNFPAGRAEQKYVLRMGLGSYAGAGALSWTILPMPDFCKPQNAQRINQQSNTWKAQGVPIPFKIQEISSSNILNTRAIAIPSGQEQVLSHQSIDLQGFNIKVDEIHMTCGASVFN